MFITYYTHLDAHLSRSQILTLYKDERLAPMSAIEIFSNKDENEFMVSFYLDEESQVAHQESFVYIPYSDLWLNVDDLHNSKAQEKADRLARSLIESYLMNVGGK
jgi:hypothetical protein